jgi:hypothetical protein
VTDPATLELVSQLAARISERQTEFSRGLGHLLSGIQHLDGDPYMVELLQASVDANINTILHLLGNHIPIEHLQPTTAAVEFALRLAQRGVPPDALVRAYHMGQDHFLGEFFAEAERADAPPQVRIDALRHVARTLFRYIDWITVYLIDRYEEERQRWSSTSGNLYSSLLHQVVAGEETDPVRFRAETAYDLAQTHVAAMIWTTVDAPTLEDLRRMERFSHTLAGVVDAPAGPIFTAVDRGLGWAWYPRGRDGGPLDTEAVAEAVRGTPFRLSVGLPGRGIDGFRRSHQQAEDARQLALAAPAVTGPVLSYDDRGVAVVAMLARDIDATRAWVQRVLGPLAAATEHAGRLRDTVLAYHAADGNQAETAARLNLHRNSVRYRLERAEELRGRPLADGRLDVEVALLVCHYLGTPVLAPAAST